MNRKGFTIVELLGAMAILGIIIAIAGGVYTKVYENQKEHTYKNKVSTIEVAAEKWAEETNLSRTTTITVKRLVAESFYQADEYDEENTIMVVNDPRDDSSMLCNTIDVVVEDGSVKAKFTGEKDCDLSNKEEERAKVKIAAYEYDIVTKKVLKTLKDRDNPNTLLPWTRHAVLLVVEPTEEGYRDYTRVIYTNGAYSEEKVVKNNILNTSLILNKVIEPNDYANTYLVDTEVLLNTEYNIAIDLPKSDNNDKIYGLKSNDIIVRIDKEVPSITTSVDGGYTTSSKKKVVIKGSDGAGSGLKTFYVTTSPNGYKEGELMNNPSNPLVDNTLEIELGLGTYYVYGEDNVGNINDNNNGKGPEKIEIINIDDSSPSCVISITRGTLGKNGWYTSDVELTFTTSIAGATGYNYYFGTSSSPTYSGGIASGYVKEKESTTKKYTVTSNGTQQYYGYIKTPLGVTAKCDTTGINGGKGLKIDKEPPSIRPINNPKNLGNEDYKFVDNVIAVCGVSGLERVVCVPPESKKTGVYDVECSATCNNGLSASTSFKAQHSYLAPYKTTVETGSKTVTYRCSFTSDCWETSFTGTIDPGCGSTATKCKMTGDSCKDREQWKWYCCSASLHPDTCPGGNNHCSGDYSGDCGGSGDCCKKATEKTYGCPKWSGTLDGLSYTNISASKSSSSKNGTCYYCPKGGTFNSSDKKCHF